MWINWKQLVVAVMGGLLVGECVAQFVYSPASPPGWLLVALLVALATGLACRVLKRGKTDPVQR